MTAPFAFLGTGFAYPPAFDPTTGGVALVAGADSVRACLQRLFETSVGEQFFVPQFGCNLTRYLFEGDTDVLRALIDTEVRRAIKRWEPRIDRVLDLQVLSGAVTGAPNTVSIQLTVALIHQATPLSLVFPFQLRG